MKFKDLSIGDKFRFDSEIHFPFSGMKRGVCRKLSPRKYEYVDEPDFPTCKVGSIHVGVLTLETYNNSQGIA